MTAVILAGGITASVPAFAQEVVMRRPLPRLTTANGPIVPVPVPPGEEEVISIDDEPTPTAICDDENVVVKDPKWVEAGLIQTGGDASCPVRSMRYICQASFTCFVNGNMTSYAADAPDSTCENFDGQVGYPPGTGGSGCDPFSELCNEEPVVLG